MTENPTSILVRAAEPDDALDLASLKVVCWRSAYPGLIPQSELDHLDAASEAPHWRDWLSDSESRMIACLVELDGELVGYGLAGPMRLGDRPGREIDADAELYALYVHPDHLRKGLGQRLMAALLEKMMSDGYSSLGAWMVGGNLVAEAFYHKLGAEEAGKRVEIRHGRIAYREKAWRWSTLSALKTNLERLLMQSEGER